MAEERVQRRLAAILAADMVGYTRMMDADEAGTFARLNKLRSEMFDPTTSRYGGRIFKNTGDGALAEFASTVEAVDCAVAIQRQIAAGNRVPEDRQITLRIGISLGDVIIQGDDLYGNGVNLAVRLEAMAEPGGICVAQAAYEQCRGSIEVAFSDLGEQQLKHVAQPVRVWAWSTGRDSASSADELVTARAVLARPAIAVLPFRNMSGDPGQDYFADGVTEEIITALARWREFPVIARNSAFAYKGKDVDVVRAAKELGARYVLEGSVRRVAERVRITAQLIDGDNGHHLWAERYDRQLVDIFALQDEITEKVASEVAPALRLAETQRIARKQPDSLDAWDHYLRALALRAKYTTADFIAAERELEAAIQLDPEFAAAHAELAIVCVSIATMWRGKSDASLAKARLHALRAIELDEFDAAAHYAIAFAYTYANQAEAGVVSALRAVALNPNVPLAWYYLATAQLYSDRLIEAGDSARRAIALGPQEAWLWTIYAMLGLADYLAGRYGDCIDNLRRSRALRPAENARRRDGYTAAALAQLGRDAEARAVAASILQRWPDFGPEMYAGLPLLPHQRDALRDGLLKAGLAA
jgi:adenylate cyclase